MGISLASVKLKLMLIQLTSTTDMPDTLDTDSDMDMLDTHMLVSMEVTHMPLTVALMLMPLMLMLHLTQPTPILSTPPVWESAPTTLALKFHANYFSQNVPKFERSVIKHYF